MANEFELPEDIIQHIQSYLNVTEASRSSVLSKSWYAAWFTCPVLSFDKQDCFNLTRKTLQRYEKSNLKIRKFNLDLGNCSCYCANELRSTDVSKLRVRELSGKWSCYCVKELITGALKLGVNELFTIFHTSLPNQVLTSDSLTKLSVKFASIPHLNDGGRVHCPRLVSLVLYQCDICDSIIRDILSGCPLIEHLDLDHCYSLHYVNVSNLRKLQVLRIRPHNSRFSLEFNDIGIGSFTSVVKFRELRVLKLEEITVDSEFFSEFSRRFPCMEELVLNYCHGFEEVRISSHSIKYISLSLYQLDSLKKVNLDVPNICKFRVEMFQNRLPSLSFSTASRDWVSHIDLVLQCIFSRPSYALKANWFMELREFLKGLSHSTVTLHIRDTNRHTMLKEFPCFITAVVENVIVHMHIKVSMSNQEIGDLFRIFRPDFITKNANFGGSPRLVEDILAYKENNHQKRSNHHVTNEKKCSITLQSVVGASNLDEVTLELFEETMLQWQSVPLKKLIDGQKPPYKENQVRLRFRWRPKRNYSRKEQKGFTASFPYSVFRWFMN